MVDVFDLMQQVSLIHFSTDVDVISYGWTAGKKGEDILDIVAVSIRTN